MLTLKNFNLLVSMDGNGQNSRDYGFSSNFLFFSYRFVVQPYSLFLSILYSGLVVISCPPLGSNILTDNWICQQLTIRLSLLTIKLTEICSLFVRQLKGIHHSIILFNFSLVAITETSLITLCLYEFNVTPKPLTGLNSHAWALCLVGVLSFYGQLLLTKALQQEEAGLVSITRASSEVCIT